MWRRDCAVFFMKNSTLFLPGFHWASLRRRPRSLAQKLAAERARIRDHSLIRLSECFGRFIPEHRIEQASSGPFSRRRLLSKTNTFWAFFAQILSGDGGCREVVRKLQSLACVKGLPMPSSSTSAYCQARAKLDEATLANLLEDTSQQLRRRNLGEHWHQRRVVVVDGSGIGLPDTPENQAQWPQSGAQKPGCGFPQLRLCACFALDNGGLLSHRVGSLKHHELPLLRQQWDCFESGDILLGDKGFCSYYDVWKLQQIGVDSVHALARRTPANEATALKALGKNDLLIQWKKPKWNNGLSYDKATWQTLPETLTLRQIKVTVPDPGFRTREYYLITTLLDDRQYSSKALADLYRQRWDVELHFRDLKTTLGMETLRCRTPEMVIKELLMNLIVYNVIRLLMSEAARPEGLDPRTISFKASLQALRQWEPQLSMHGLSTVDYRRLVHDMLGSIASATLLQRPGRNEPRCIKRRPKPFGLLTQHRHSMKETPHRGRYRAKTA